jgi:hypothetical protein
MLVNLVVENACQNSVPVESHWLHIDILVHSLLTFLSQVVFNIQYADSDVLRCNTSRQNYFKSIPVAEAQSFKLHPRHKLNVCHSLTLCLKMYNSR